MDKKLIGTEVERRETAFFEANPPPDILDYFVMDKTDVHNLQQRSKKMSKVTICVECKYCYREKSVPQDLDDDGSLAWLHSSFYSEHLCKASPITPRINLVTGKPIECSHRFCKDVNDGKCKLFEPKEQKDAKHDQSGGCDKA